MIATSRDLHRNIAQEAEAEAEAEADLRSRMLVGEEHLDRSHRAGLAHTHTKVAGVGRHLAEDTVRLEEPENLAAIGVAARTLAPVGD